MTEETPPEIVWGGLAMPELGWLDCGVPPSARGRTASPWLDGTLTPLQPARLPPCINTSHVAGVYHRGQRMSTGITAGGVLCCSLD